MSVRFWSFVLQWSRVGISAALFLIATRYLSLTEIGLFASAYAPIRLTQGLHKAGVAETAILFADQPKQLDALFVLSVGLGLFLTLGLGIVSWFFASEMLSVLAVLPVIHGLSAVSDGVLRHRLKIRALAVRTALSQSLAAAFAFWLLSNGLGAWALVAFACTNVLLAAALTLALARWWPKTRPNWKIQALLWRNFTQIALRDLTSSALLPSIQIAVAASLGLSAAGAFQIATRVLSLIDALALSPLRFIALPELKHSVNGTFRAALMKHVQSTALLSCWIWGGTVATAPTLVALTIGENHAQSVTPILLAYAGFGLISALSMPINQALTASGHTELVLLRAVVLLVAGWLCAAPALLLSPTWVAVGLSAAAVITFTWYLKRANQVLPVSAKDTVSILRPMTAGTLMAGILASTQYVITNVPPLPAMVLNVVLGTVIYGGLLRAFSHRSLKKAQA